MSFNSIHKDCRSIDLIHSRANVGTSIHQPIYNDVHEKEINTESKSQSGNEINKNSKDWNEQRFGLAEYSDTVGPPGERYFVTIYTRKLSLYNFRAYFHVAWRHGTSKEIYMAYNVGYLQHCVCSKCQVGSFQMICKQQSKNY